MERPHQLHWHRSSLEGVIVPSSQPLKVEERGLAIRVFDEIIRHFEPCQATDIGYKPVTLIRLMKNEVSEKDEFLDLFFSFIHQELLGEREGTGLEQVLSHLARYRIWSAEETNSLRDCLVIFAKYLVNNFFLPLKALAVKTPQPTPALSHSRTPEATFGTPQRVSNLRQACLIRDRHRCVISRKFDAEEGQGRYKRDGPNSKDDDGKSLLEERDNMAFLEVAHIIPHSLMSLTSEEGEWRLADSKQIAYRTLRMFNPGAIHLINGVDIDRPMNALTLTHDLHKLFGNFDIAFEPVGSEAHTYKIDYVETDRMGRVERLPVSLTLYLTPDRSIDPPSQLLKIHAAIGRILHLSAAGDYIDDFLQDIEETEAGEVMPNGSTRLDDYVWFRLGETSVY
ncbi:hypothetical protein KXV73_005715 [Aspergillus fumigatus]|uniref:HNH nuclease domain-containing protein n=1 Tax=Aspergillus fumigatus (strain CBS 144.89 / FGSC A1163 / CEA10) TaxID=451804 RepID=B0XXR9_ASPFC|nr:conserved hypothetical protein [Aspergillus fumigatus A1163]KAH1314713.1 hypothetical protein KXX38_003112 [Aspergillus fumigatus]KAH1968622.1 hypothetical protein KXV80_001832 [Aspergillus fumigatus]KAH2185894.1 hypothetical protein KXV88_001708 [Aspergillus fumigatus]KAH2195299.1 hypothetical protein KXW59_005694 [Aspergillus fumigatus]